MTILVVRLELVRAGIVTLKILCPGTRVGATEGNRIIIGMISTRVSKILEARKEVETGVMKTLT